MADEKILKETFEWLDFRCKSCNKDLEDLEKQLNNPKKKRK